MATLNTVELLSYNQRTKGHMMTEEIEWISTRDAMPILKVKSTQAVRYLMEQYPDELPKYNFGSIDQPRWMLRRADVILFQARRTPPDTK